MKKLIILMFAALLVFAFTVPAAAVEHQFGGYWRTRAYMQKNFNGFDATIKGTANGDVGVIDTRTRLYYTAVINDNLKLVNKFEMDATWGGQDTTFIGQSLRNSYGDFGADGIALEIKNSYAEFNWLNSIWRVGVQPWILNKGFQSDLDAPGVLWMYPSGDHLYGAGYVRVLEGGGGYDMGEDDIEFFALFAVFKLAEGMTIQPWTSYAYSDTGGLVWRNAAATNWPAFTGQATTGDGTISAHRIGFDFNWNTDQFGLWVEGIYLFGSIGYDAANDFDLGAYLGAFGGHWNLGAGDIHCEFFYASGDDNPNDHDWEQFSVFEGQSHYWAEIMGLGLFDNQASANSPADNVIGNIYAANLGVTWTFAEKHKITADLWYAARIEKTTPLVAFTFPDESLGTELDLRYTYPIVEGLNLDLVAAYLFAGDGTYKQVGAGPDSEDPYELGMQLSLSF